MRLLLRQTSGATREERKTIAYRACHATVLSQLSPMKRYLKDKAEPNPFSLYTSKVKELLGIPTIC